MPENKTIKNRTPMDEDQAAEAAAAAKAEAEDLAAAAEGKTAADAEAAASGDGPGAEDSAEHVETEEERAAREKAEEFARVRTKANRYFFGKVAVNALLMIIGAVLIALFLRSMQGRAALEKQRENNEQALSDAVSILEANAEDAEDLTNVFHDGNQDMLDDLGELFKSGLFDDLVAADTETRSEVFADIVQRSGVDYIFVTDYTGKVLISPNIELFGKDLVQQGILSPESLQLLLSGTRRSDGSVVPAVEDNSLGYYYLYSRALIYDGQTYRLILVTGADTLDVQISSLTDVSVVLRRTSVGNDGFLFAVDTTTDTFLYYENGEDVLTGESALEAGLSKDALKDGYAGIQTINGTRYYCVSRTFGKKTVICAAADTEVIHAKDKYVLFWSITGFVLVMLICLAYAVIIRNDFVRHATETKRRVIYDRNGRKVIFDRSVFNKVFPLMVAGVITIFLISFYTQTLLEISESIDDSKVALDEVGGRYQESIANREVIRGYYDNRFLSKARLIAYLLEEDPSVLNEDTIRIHSEYDSSGNKHFILDDEGNSLRSVASSARLQELCDANDIESVYIFDEDGRTIATSTPNWYFTVSHDPELQSYDFLQVLDGKTDAFIQEPMVDDLGEASQYIGVAFNYYTSVDEDGKTVYMSRYAQESRESSVTGDEEDFYSEEETASAPITAHRGMLQIGLDQELSEMLLASTDLDYVFSTDMLKGGFVVVFDDTEDHTILYSPFEARIGLRASEIGITDKAFSGSDYYGFTRVNGVRYFQFFRYSDGYFAATAIPKSEMFKARFPIALITAITSLLLILILSGTVTLTTDEEEELYATMSDSQAAKGLDSTIFKVILPSGHTVSTTKAAARWDNSRVPWREKGPEQKLLSMISAVCALLIFYVLLAVLGAGRFFGDNSVIKYILSSNWDRGPNVFAFSGAMLVMISTALAVSLFRAPVRLITSMLGARGETIGHLLISVVKYGGAIAALFYCLYLFGVDSTSLLASAGVLTLVVGLGAQSLIKDIIAGIFIVFEGEFRVGDIVTINDFRGTVMDIGLRTT